jgi:DNA-binding transcriptional LysR family regulator
MFLQPEELRPFLVLAEELHFRKAAERLFVSQPALSKQIRRLEEKIGGPLFARTRRKVALTEAGRVLIPVAEKLNRESRLAFDSVRAAAKGRAGLLRIGFGIASVSAVLPRTILRFRRDHPLVELQMRDMSTPSQVAALLDGKIDIGIVRLPIAHTELESRPLFSDHLVAAAPRSVPFHRTEGLASFRDRPFICLPRSVSETFHDHVLSLCRRAGFSPRVVQEASELFTILNLVRAGLGVSLVPSSAVLLHVPGVRFHDLRMGEAEWSIGVAWNKLAEKRELIARFTSTIRSVVRRP